MKSEFMNVAISEAKISAKAGEVPVGACVVCDGKIVSVAHNMTEKNGDPTAHAEILAIKKAAETLKTWRLDNCDLYVTLEPCPMCAGAIMNARIKAVYFGAYDMIKGAAGGKLDLFREDLGQSKTLVYGGICEEDCAKILKDFFSNARK